MAIFVCKVMTPQGQITKIKIEEKDKVACTKKLKRNGMTPIEIKETFILKRKNDKKITGKIYSRRKRFVLNIDQVINFRNKVSSDELKEFTKSFYMLKQSDFTDAHALTTIINNTKNDYFKKVLRKVLDSVESENYMYRAMRNYPDVFPIVYINFIKTGEHTNTVQESLKHAIRYLEDDTKIKDKINNTIIPNFLMFLGIIIFIFLSLAIGVPNLQRMIASSGVSVAVPRLTLLLSRIFRGFVKYWYVFVIIIAVMLCIIIRYLNTDEGKADLDNLKYKNPFFGKAMYLIDFSRVVKSVYLNLQNNMRIQDALEISKSVTKNVQMHSIIEKSLNNVYMGKSWLEPFEDEKTVSSIIIELLKKGFRSKKIDVLDRTINYLDKVIEEYINDSLKRMLEISYIVIGIALVAFIILVLIPYIRIYLSGLLFF